MNNKYSIVAINLAYWGKNVSCLGSAETNLKYNTFLQLYKLLWETFKLISW